MSGVSLVYVTVGQMEEASAIARCVVQERLAACANLLPVMQSVYRWEGRLHEEHEVVLLLKTRADLVEALTARVKSLHSYSCPCVVALSVAAGNRAFLQWVAAETKFD